MSGTLADWLKIAAVAPVLALIVWSDMRKQIIPDRLVLIGLAIAVLFTAHACARGQTVSPLWEMLASFAISGAPLMLVILVTRGGMGAGDMKLMAMLGALFMWRAALLSMLFGIILAGVFALVLMLLRKASRGTRIPLAPFITAGLLLVIVFHAQLERFVWVYYGFTL